MKDNMFYMIIYVGIMIILFIEWILHNQQFPWLDSSLMKILNNNGLWSD